MPTVSETIELDGIRCERCVMRLAKVLEGHDGLDSASATLMGQVSVVYDDERTSRDALLGAIARGGFKERLGGLQVKQALEVGIADGRAGDVHAS